MVINPKQLFHSQDAKFKKLSIKTKNITNLSPPSLLKIDNSEKIKKICQFYLVSQKLGISLWSINIKITRKMT